MYRTNVHVQLAYLLILFFIGASGCTLYQPLTTMLPAVNKQGDAAIAGNWQIPYGGQGSVIASPVPHILLFASGGFHAHNTKRDSSNNFARIRQYEGGIGSYATVGQVWLGASIGAGQGRGYRYGRFGSPDFFNFGVPSSPGSSGGLSVRPQIPELLGHYNTRFAQVTAWWPDARLPSLKWGTSLRWNQVRITDLTLNGMPQPLSTQHYLQASVVMQKRLWRRLDWQATACYDLGFGFDKTTDEKVFPRAPLRVGLGLAFCPTKNHEAQATGH